MEKVIDITIWNNFISNLHQGSSNILLAHQIETHNNIRKLESKTKLNIYQELNLAKVKHTSKLGRILENRPKTLCFSNVHKWISLLGNLGSFLENRE